MTRSLLTALIAALIVIGFALLGGTKTLGAHPFWSLNVALIGAPIGGLLALGLFVMTRWYWGPLVCSVILAAVAYGVAHFGKLRFAASYAEDAFAGQMWFFGWIATALFITLTLALALRPRG